MHFGNGSFGVFSCFPSGNLPESVQISAEGALCFIRPSEETSWVWDGQEKLGWAVFNAKLGNKSILTTSIVEEIFNTNKSSLTSYEESMKMHVALLNPLLDFLKKRVGKKYTYCPFT